MPPVILVFTVTGSALFVISCFFLGWGAKADDSGSNPLKTVGWIAMVAGVVDLLSALYIVTRSGLPAAEGTSAADAATAANGALLLGGLVGLLSSVIPYSCELVALRSLRPSVFGILMSLEPAAAALAGWLVLGETLSAGQWAALLCVIVASIGATRDWGPEPLA